MNFNDKCSLNPSLFKINIENNTRSTDNQHNARAIPNNNEQTIPAQINRNLTRNGHIQNTLNHNQSSQINSVQNLQNPHNSQTFNNNNPNRVSSIEPQTDSLITKLKGKMQIRNETNLVLLETINNLYKKDLDFLIGKIPSITNINSLNNKPNQLSNNIINSNSTVNHVPVNNLKNVSYLPNTSSSINTLTSCLIPNSNISNKSKVNTSQTPMENSNTSLNRKRHAEVSVSELEGLIGNSHSLNNEKITKNVDASINRQKIEIQSKFEENSLTNTTRNIRTEIKKEEFSQEKDEVVVLLDNLKPQFDSNVITYTNKYVIEIRHKTKNIRYVLEVEKNSLNVIYNEKIMRECSTHLQLNNATDFRTYIKSEIQSYL